MSLINVNAMEPSTGTDITLGASGDTITVPSGATITNSGTATGFGATLTGTTNNTVTTVTAANAISGEANLTFDGTDLTLGTGNLIIGTGGKGIDFSAQTGTAASGASTTSELLDHYEEGTWTPSMYSGATMTAGTVNGYYTRIGRMVFCNGVYVSTSLNGASGSIRLRGLPFTSSSSGNAYSSGTPSYAVNLNITAGNTFTIRAELGAVECYLALFDVSTGATEMQASEWSDDGEMRFAFKYMV